MSSYSILSDIELVFLLKEGDKNAFNEIYERYKYILHAHAINKIRDREEARDIIQEVFTYLWDKREVINIGSSVSGYLYTIVRNTILNKVLNKQVEKRYLDSIKAYSLEYKVQTDFKVRESQLREFVEREIAKIPPRMREVFELSRNNHLSHKEIAEKLQISEQTVSKQVSNVLKILKVKLGIFIYLCWAIHKSLDIVFHSL